MHTIISKVVNMGQERESDNLLRLLASLSKGEMRVMVLENQLIEWTVTKAEMWKHGLTSAEQPMLRFQ